MNLPEHVERLLGLPVVGWRPVVGGGWSASVRGVAELGDGRTVFAKLGDVPGTIEAIRGECAIYPLLSGPFLPRLVAADPSVPVLVVEDLSGATWPPPWTPGLLAGLGGLFAELAATRAPAGLASLADRVREIGAWELVAADRGPFLTTGAASAEWLDRALPALLAAQGTAPTAGDSLLHFDVRSDNLCFRDGRALLVDWNHAVSGDPRWDRLLMLHTIQMEGGPPVRELDPDPVPGILAWTAGFFAARAGLPPPVGAPRVRGFQRAQLEVVLPWAAEVLGLPAPA